MPPESRESRDLVSINLGYEFDVANATVTQATVPCESGLSCMTMTVFVRNSGNAPFFFDLFLQANIFQVGVWVLCVVYVCGVGVW